MGVRSLRFSFSLSLALHALFLLVCIVLISHRPAISPKKLTWIEIETAPKKKQSKDEDIRKQIVQTIKGEEVKEASKNAFLGEKTQNVDRETVSKKRTTVIGKSSVTARPKPKSSAKQMTEEKSLSKFALQMIPKPGERKEPQEQNQDTPQWAHFSDAPEDYVKGIKESDRTALNTKEYVFFGYFQRIRQRLDRAWIPILREKLLKLYRTGRQLASDMDHSTRVLVILNPKGEIIRIELMSESGTSDLDDAAVRAFNEAGPFPNPPRGIVDVNGEVQIPWEFILRT